MIFFQLNEPYMKTQLRNIESRLKASLLALNDDSPLERYRSASAMIDASLVELKEYLLNYHFQNDAEEIYYFKCTRPMVLSCKIEEGLRYNLTVNKPIGTDHVQVSYYEGCIRGLESFFRLNEFFYQYYKNEFTDLDALYFTRKSGPLKVPHPEIIDSDLQFSTPMSDVFARFIAYEHVQYYILGKVAEMNDNRGLSTADGQQSALKWTGEVVNLVELAYGIWLTGQMNNGNASLNEIVRWLEMNMQVKIGIVQRKFTEIERRKRLSITKFIDQMKDAVLNKIASGYSE